MDEKDWLVLKVLAEKRSITKAAKILSLSQPALSSRLQQMELRFATNLVIRTQKGIRFTPEGDYLVKQARQLLTKMEEIDHTINAMKGHVSGVLNIGSATFCAKYMLPEILKRYQERYPDIQFKVVSGNSDDIFKMLYEDKVQLAFVRGDYKWNQKVMLFGEDMYLASSTPIKDLQDLPNLPQIDYIHNYFVKIELKKWWHSHFDEDPNVSIMVDDIDTAYEMISKGLGYTFVSGWVINRYKNLYTYPMYLKNGKPLTRKTWLFYTDDVLQIKSVKSFFEFVTAMDYSTQLPK